MFNKLKQALKDYDGRLRPHINRIQQKARDFAPNFVPGSRWRIRIVQLIIRFSNIPFVKNFIGKQFSVNSVIPPKSSEPS